MRPSIRRFASVPVLAPWDVLAPLQRLWWAALGVPLLAVLHGLVGFLALWPVTLAIGPFGLAVIAMTVLVRLVLLPLTVYQVRANIRARRQAVALQARLAPEVEALRRRHRGRPLEFQRALAELLRERGASSLGGLASSLLPTLAQAPLLIALYWVILAMAHASADLHFLWVASLSVPDPLLLPVLAGLSTLLVSRLAARVQPPRWGGDDDQAAAAQRTLSLLFPIGLAVSAHFAPAALVLYWLTGNLLSAAQQWTVNRLLPRTA